MTGSVVADGPLHRTEHEITIAASASEVYQLIADVTRWPVVFGPTVHVEHLERSATRERFRIWATAKDEVKTWTSVRELDPVARTIAFRQEVSQPPVARMGGRWRMEAVAAGRTRVVFGHTYRAIDDDPDSLAWIDEVVDRNSRVELAGLQSAAERGRALDELSLTFEDTVRMAGPRAAAYDFVREAAEWPRRLPHVARLALTEDEPGVQVMEMDTIRPDGTVHTTRSVRICFPQEKIVYKQLVPPALLSAHTGCWLFEETGDGVAVTSRHTVVVDPEAVPTVLGPGATVAEAQEFARNALSRDSMTTLLRAKSFVERARGAAG
ncbi:aromatase [Streptoalloteichus tenebrarius]|uniref:Aromatase n=1 Tax=Streptoalloteichus tenebrarius (strain ATCC 17920 / DSM 40477 / JCM 4838 / CBS 697.72 / NBRC 16177 / NCIMB 11028 / NRRL B-12390 / A12253. 1 / ISP 5477) TaxID=1933 RepID=A0ABT1I4U0_STRSD|nr:aromatase/cyclase [Streptoalloteichus tenebrarius]MCP2262595.1 aromatase [Streptoalloteichus tenebrarius]BFF02990.1 SRPBCC family protein [Streptoalloteichus tenebrarius]